MSNSPNLSKKINKKENSMARSNQPQRLPKVSRPKISHNQNSYSKLYDVTLKKGSKNSMPPSSKPNLPSLQGLDKEKEQNKPNQNRVVNLKKTQFSKDTKIFTVNPNYTDIKKHLISLGWTYNPDLLSNNANLRILLKNMFSIA